MSSIDQFPEHSNLFGRLQLEDKLGRLVILDELVRSVLGPRNGHFGHAVVRFVPSARFRVVGADANFVRLPRRLEAGEGDVVVESLG